MPVSYLGCGGAPMADIVQLALTAAFFTFAFALAAWMDRI
jgi:hypothetical protein